MISSYIVIFLLFSQLGPLHWEPVDLPGVRLGGVDRLTGKVKTNYRHADLNQDGHPDLVFQDCVLFSNNGGEAKYDRAELPATPLPRLVGVFSENVYILHPNGVLVGNYQEQNTLTFHAYQFDGGVQTSVNAFLKGVEISQVNDFLLDPDEDGDPEIVVLDESSIVFLHCNPESHAVSQKASIPLDLPPQLVATEPGTIWPDNERKIIFPTLDYSYNFFAQGTKIVLCKREKVNAGVQYRIQSFELEKAESGKMSVKTGVPQTAGPFPDFVQPCQKSSEGNLAFVGESLVWRSLSPIPVPIHEVIMYSGDATPIVRVRNTGLAPHSLMVDMNHDGRMDLITERMLLFEGDVKEIALRVATQRVLEHRVNIHLQRDDGSFDRLPDFSKDFSVNMGVPPIQDSEMFRQYQRAELIKVTGDFTGDGRCDVLVKTSESRLSLYPFEKSGFPNVPVLEQEFEPGFTFAVDDVDGDGRSDLMLCWPALSDEPGGEKTQVFVTRDSSP
ncbi:MAG TPA: VCBS repeat-containing protein [Candidatus Hydrogenedentes bacterium]|nr:VCBS repeat-containing protein [Candidatus Hydrogenedentota bacterium]HOL77575.1 VCBS repeat-containing protein [Candidatus Hydrogenedentota bacterium]HPO84880.1 VCBS repeat-containing protein [Candidatus Hydrogenedentota bacterium]